MDVSYCDCVRQSETGRQAGDVWCDEFPPMDFRIAPPQVISDLPGGQSVQAPTIAPKDPAEF